MIAKIKLPKKAKDISNQRFGRLIAIKPVLIDKWKQIIWLCQCDCGKSKKVRGKHLWAGNIKSCGCLVIETSSKKALRHGYARKGMVTPIHSIWQGMIDRCTNPNSERFKDYGGRGIPICERWMKFENFLADMGERPPGYSIERIDNNKGYCPENCKWIPRNEQARNTRRSVMLTAFGESKCLSQWVVDYRCSISNEGLRRRIINGWEHELAISAGAFKK